MASDTSGPMPAVSVVVTAYNAERWIEETIRSVLAQTWRDLELVVVDDGSTDATAQIVKRYGAPVRYLHQENQGQPAARNAGIRAARGRYVAFLDADDLWLPTKLERQMSLFEDDPDLAWCYTDAFLFDSKTGRTMQTASQANSLHEGDILRPLLLANFIASPTPVVRRDVFEEVGYFDQAPAVRGGGGEDWDMWLRIAARHPIGLVRAPLAKYRLHHTSMTQAMDLDHALRGRLGAVERAARRSPERVAGVKRRAMANVHATVGRWALNREERSKARGFFFKALRHAPTSLYAWTYALASLLPRPVLRLLGRLRQAVRLAPSDRRGGGNRIT